MSTSFIKQNRNKIDKVLTLVKEKKLRLPKVGEGYRGSIFLFKSGTYKYAVKRYYMTYKILDCDKDIYEAYNKNDKDEYCKLLNKYLEWREYFVHRYLSLHKNKDMDNIIAKNLGYYKKRPFLYIFMPLYNGIDGHRLLTTKFKSQKEMIEKIGHFIDRVNYIITVFKKNEVVHGDFHPGNLQGDNVKNCYRVIDFSRTFVKDFGCLKDKKEFEERLSKQYDLKFLLNWIINHRAEIHKVNPDVYDYFADVYLKGERGKIGGQTPTDAPENWSIPYNKMSNIMLSSLTSKKFDAFIKSKSTSGESKSKSTKSKSTKSKS